MHKLMARIFQIPLKEHPEILLNKAARMARENAVHFVADQVEGHFAGKGLEGSYRFEGDMLVVSVSRKPPFVTWGMVEKMLKQFFA
ncbi:hypothetical protein MIT9_P0024 [Methylomarinovum caldicuralii]|uniref:Uncharacterized protein n=2 Tax=Methylomarinovum caldicuralii TaxID=438856 RepID=A0AAU9C4Y7_9GAMM|nr:hypothetical protein MIT9_P0024 [Methylomarinovum caldicuralii]